MGQVSLFLFKRPITLVLYKRPITLARVADMTWSPSGRDRLAHDLICKAMRL